MSAADDTGLVVGVDTHLDTHTAAICDARGRAGSQLQVPSTAEGYAQLLEWARDAAGGLGDRGHPAFGEPPRNA